MTAPANIRDAALHCEAKKHAYRQTQEGVVVSFVLHPQEVPDGLALSRLGTRYMLAVVEIGDDEKPVTPPTKQEPERRPARREFGTLPIAQQAALRCNDPLYRAFLREGHIGPAGDADEAADTLRKHCGVASRKDISSPQWVTLETCFENWKVKERVS